MSVAINPQPTVIEIGAVQRLFEAGFRSDPYGGLGTGWVYDVMADGQRFLINRIVPDAGVEPPIRVVTNWTSSIGR